MKVQAYFVVDHPEITTLIRHKDSRGPVRLDEYIPVVNESTPHSASRPN